MKNSKTNTVKIHAEVKNNDAKITITTPNGEKSFIDTYNSIFVENKKRPKKYEIESFITGLLFNEDTKELLLRNSEKELFKWGDDKIYVRNSCKIELELTGDIEKKYKFDFIIESKIIEKEKVDV
jgi:hypothetical protein